MGWNGLVACVSERWTPQIGDPEITGWLTVLAYLACAGLSLVVWQRLPHGRARGFWAAITALTLFLAVNKQLDLQTALTAAGRCLANAQGWYAWRRPVQLAFLLLLAAGVLAALRAGKRALRGNRRANRWALRGVAILAAFVMMRAVGFHGFDAMIGQRLFGVRLNFIFENAGLVLIALNAVAILRREPERAARQP